MNTFIDINNRELISHALTKLKADSKPIWGKMTPQQMVEHLIDQVEHTNGKKIPTLDVPEDAAAEQKQIWIYTDIAIPHNVFLKVMDENYIHPTLDAAKAQLLQELADFDHYFNGTDRSVIHGGFGPMTYS